MGLKKEFLVLGFLAFVLVLLNVGFSSAADTCYITTSATCATNGHNEVLKLSETDNAQASLATQSNFPSTNVLCCDFGSGETSCTGTNKFLGLSSSANAHGERPDAGSPTYGTSACYDFGECRLTTSNCVTSGPQSGREVDVLRLQSSPANTHLGSSYSNKICCKVVTPPNTFNITSPNGGNNFQIGSQPTITWTYTGSISNVNIELSRNSGSSWETLVSGTGNDGSYDWIVAGATTSQALIRVLDSAAITTNDISDAVFTISDTPAPPGNPCYVTDAYWQVEGEGIGIDSPAVISGNPATLVAKGYNSDCVGEIATFTVNKDGFSEELQADLPGHSTTPELQASFFDVGGYYFAKVDWTTSYNNEAASFGYQYHHLNATTNMNTINSKDTIGNPMLKVFVSTLTSGITICPDYTPYGQEICLDDPNGVSNSTECISGSCYCDWDANSCKTKSFASSEGQCTYTSTSDGDCATDQFVTLTVDGTWIGSEGAEKTACETQTTRVLECPAQIALPFFGGAASGIYGVLITALVVVAVYWIINLNHGHERKRRKKRK